MKKVIKAEMYKLFHTKAFVRVLFIMLLFVCAPLIMSSNMIDNAASGLDFFHKIVSSSEVYLAIIIISAITADYTQKTIKNLICSGISRTKIYFGRYTSTFLVCFITCIIYGIVGTVCYTIKCGFGGNLISKIPEMLMSFGLQTLYLAVFVAVVYFLATLFRKTSISLALSLAYCLGGSYIFMLLDAKFNLGLTSFAMNELLSSIISLKVNADFFIHFTVLTIVTALVISTVGVFVFKKRDIK